MVARRASDMAKAPTFKSLKAAAEAGYHGKSVNIEGKGLQKVAFADKEYDKKRLLVVLQQIKKSLCLFRRLVLRVKLN